ncbi:DUF3576 domain-containing protein [Oceanicella actignis]|uniref:DUF3576 domain-containing protein n=1 Tax=Oceanicella actignis TaxID=1189325 RepID=A0A1M7T2N5_9RHOB|nr:DUF3576 domain-containing protein [Oceanicella actignis]TYO88868.1 uncharacterized protein DUF3576 [Oceanicella actignis]SET39139.1 protein of unknown function [Oceanicella actignis]SHN64917.1 protein of unknown function [Oceanicella actignis]
MNKILPIAGALAASLALGACGGGTPPKEQYDPTLADMTRDRRASTIGDLLRANRVETEGGGAGIAINRHLWRASLDTLAFLPLSSTDPFSGVIATDWGVNPDAPDERFKVTVLVSSPKLEASSLKVAVYRQVRGEGGEWLPAPVSPETARKLEDAILARARQIKVAELAKQKG